MPKLKVKTDTLTPQRHESSDQYTSFLGLKHSRRGFLQLGLVASTSLALASNIAKASELIKPATSNTQSAIPYRFLDNASAEFFSALLPVVLAKENLDKSTIKSMLLALDSLIFHFNAFNQKQMMQLFEVMAFAPLRLVAGAPWTSWPQATPAAIQAFLEDWRDSRFELKRMGYLSICKVINLCWYARVESYSRIGYPGPPTHIPAPV